MADIGAIISGTASVASSIAGFFGGGGGDSKAASIARRNTDALRAVEALQPISGLVSQPLWDRIQNKFLQAAQQGLSFRIAAPVICSGGFEFATKARDIINSTPPSQILRKRGGFPSWTDLGKDVTACVEAGIRSGALNPSDPTPTLPRPSSVSPGFGVTIEEVNLPNSETLSGSLNSQPLPGQPQGGSPPSIIVVNPSQPRGEFSPTFVPFAQSTPTPPTVVLPASSPPAIVEKEQDNMFLLIALLVGGGLLIFRR